MRTNMPGNSSRRGFGNTARSTTEPVLGSTEASDTLSRPCSGYWLPSSSVRVTSAWFLSSLTISPFASWRCSRSMSVLDFAMST